jgi:hypothetical protein
MRKRPPPSLSLIVVLAAVVSLIGVPAAQGTTTSTSSSTTSSTSSTSSSSTSTTSPTTTSVPGGHGPGGHGKAGIESIPDSKDRPSDPIVWEGRFAIADIVEESVPQPNGEPDKKRPVPKEKRAPYMPGMVTVAVQPTPDAILRERDAADKPKNVIFAKARTNRDGTFTLRGKPPALGPDYVDADGWAQVQVVGTLGDQVQLAGDAMFFHPSGQWVTSEERRKALDDPKDPSSKKAASSPEAVEETRKDHAKQNERPASLVFPEEADALPPADPERPFRAQNSAYDNIWAANATAPPDFPWCDFRDVLAGPEPVYTPLFHPSGEWGWQNNFLYRNTKNTSFGWGVDFTWTNGKGWFQAGTSKVTSNDLTAASQFADFPSKTNGYYNTSHSYMATLRLDWGKFSWDCYRSNDPNTPVYKETVQAMRVTSPLSMSLQSAHYVACDRVHTSARVPPNGSEYKIGAVGTKQATLAASGGVFVFGFNAWHSVSTANETVMIWKNWATVNRIICGAGRKPFDSDALTNGSVYPWHLEHEDLNKLIVTEGPGRMGIQMADMMSTASGGRQAKFSKGLAIAVTPSRLDTNIQQWWGGGPSHAVLDLPNWQGYTTYVKPSMNGYAQGANGRLGNPKWGVQGTHYKPGNVQNFDKGGIYEHQYNGASRTAGIYGPVYNKWANWGFEGSNWGFPIKDTFHGCTGAAISDFDLDNGNSSIYSNPYGAFGIWGPWKTAFAQQGHECGWMGHLISDGEYAWGCGPWYSSPTYQDTYNVIRQRFVGGQIQWNKWTGEMCVFDNAGNRRN